MTSGYYRQPEATAAITVREGGFLDSGDLAFVLDGEIHIAGRSKDLIIKGGRNCVPQEVEEVVATVAGSAAAVAWSPSGVSAPDAGHREPRHRGGDARAWTPGSGTDRGGGHGAA